MVKKKLGKQLLSVHHENWLKVAIFNQFLNWNFLWEFKKKKTSELKGLKLYQFELNWNWILENWIIINHK